MVYLWHSLIVALMALSLLMGCASSPYVGTGALVGGGLGALTGAAIGHKNPWAGGLIGGAVGTGLGAVTGYALQSRQAQPQPQQGYYQQQPRGYAPPPPGYGSRPQAPGPAYGGSYGGYNTPNPVTPGAPQYSEAPGPQYNQAPPQYEQAPPQYQNQALRQPSGVHTPITPAPYQTYE